MRLACMSPSPVAPIFTETLLPAHSTDVRIASITPAAPALRCAVDDSPGASFTSTHTPPTHKSVPATRAGPKRSPRNTAPTIAAHNGYDDAMASAVEMPIRRADEKNRLSANAYEQHTDASSHAARVHVTPSRSPP